MTRIPQGLCIAVLTVLFATKIAAAPATQTVHFDSLDRSADGKALVIDARLFEPSGAAPAGGFPAVVALHGCGGMYSSRAGFEHGGSTVLSTLDESSAVVTRFRSRPNAGPFFRAAVAFYPGCSPWVGPGRWKSDVPLQIHIGELDDWTPAKPCSDMADDARLHRKPVQFYQYANSYHAFDAPTLRFTLRTDVPNGVNPGKGVHVSANPFARAAALPRVDSFLREQLVESARP